MPIDSDFCLGTVQVQEPHTCIPRTLYHVQVSSLARRAMFFLAGCCTLGLWPSNRPWIARFWCHPSIEGSESPIFSKPPASRLRFYSIWHVKSLVFVDTTLAPCRNAQV